MSPQGNDRAVVKSPNHSHHWRTSPGSLKQIPAGRSIPSISLAHDSGRQILCGRKSVSKAVATVPAVIEKFLSDKEFHTITYRLWKRIPLDCQTGERSKNKVYFLPHHPWKKGRNENANYLLRDFFLKSVLWSMGRYSFSVFLVFILQDIKFVILKREC